MTVTKKNILWRVTLCVLVLCIGVLVMQAMASLKKPPLKKPASNPGTLVELMELIPEDRQATVQATGTVQPRRQANIVPQVSGRVLRVSPGFVPGGYFDKGDLLFEIESVDYELTAERSRAAVAQAEYGLSQVESQARVARLEWERIRIDAKEQPNPLVLYEPQLKNAQASLASAQADLKQRLLDIERTKVYAPFNCRIQSEIIDLGQFVMSGQSIGSVSGTDMAEVVIPVSLQDLRWLTVPRDPKNRGKGSTAIVQLLADVQPFEWEGRIDRSLGEVDPKGRMMRLVVSVDDPYGLKQPDHAHSNVHLAEGLFVDVILKGEVASKVFAIPASVLRENTTVWTMNADDQLEIRKVDVIRRQKEMILVRGDLRPNDLLVLTYFSGAVPGTKLRLAEEG